VTTSWCYLDLMPRAEIEELAKSMDEIADDPKVPTDLRRKARRAAADLRGRLN
jgi:uncharacterized protein (UPF0147 family)